MGGLIELVVVFAAVIGWCVIELVAMSLDKKRPKDEPPTPDSTRESDHGGAPPSDSAR